MICIISVKAETRINRPGSDPWSRLLKSETGILFIKGQYDRAPADCKRRRKINSIGIV